MILLGFAISRWRNRLPPFAGALVLFVCFLRPFYDVATNYAADAVFGGNGDVAFLLHAYPRWCVHFCAWLLMLLAAGGAFSGMWKAPNEHRASASPSA